MVRGLETRGRTTEELRLAYCCELAFPKLEISSKQLVRPSALMDLMMQKQGDDAGQ